MGAKASRRKSDGAEAQSEKKCDDPEAEADTMPAEDTPQVDITPREAAVSEEPEDVLNKSMETVETKVASVSVEDPTELVAEVPDSGAKRDSLTGFSQEASTKIEFSIPESPADPLPIPHDPLSTGEEEQNIPAAPEHSAEGTARDVDTLAMENEAVSGQETSETEELLVCVNEDDAQLRAEALN